MGTRRAVEFSDTRSKKQDNLEVKTIWHVKLAYGPLDVGYIN